MDHPQREYNRNIELVYVVAAECIYEPYIFSYLVGMSSAESSHCSPLSDLVCWQLLTLCNIVWHKDACRLLQGGTSFNRMHSGLGLGSNLEMPNSIYARYVESWLSDSGVISWRGIDHQSLLPCISPLGDDVCCVNVCPEGLERWRQFHGGRNT